MFERKLTEKDRIAFFRHLNEMTRAGITIMDAITNFESGSPALKKAVARVSSDMRRGSGVSDAIKGTGLLNALCQATLAAGERAGSLDQTFDIIVSDMEEREQFIGELKSSLAMPAINLVAALGAAFYLALSVLPKVGSSFKNFGGLPDISLRIFSAAELFAQHWYVAPLTGAAVGVAIWRIWRSQPPFLFSVPLIGSILKYFFLSVLFGGLTMAQKAGFSTLESFVQMEGTLTGHARAKIKEVIRGMKQGQHLDVVLARDTKFFPKDIVGMVRTARISGSYERIVPSISKICRKRSFSTAKKIATYAEPATLMMVGAVVLVLALAVYFPIATVGTEFRPIGK